MSDGESQASAAAAGGETKKPQLWSKASEEKLKKEFLKLQREKCKESMTVFAKCAKDAGFMVTFRCREELRIANECLHQYTTDEQYAEFRKEKIDKWVADGVLVRPPK